MSSYARAAVDAARLILIRHAESIWNASGRWQGHADPPLSERGRAQAAALARGLVEHRIDLLLASDLARAAQTAGILGEALGLEPILDQRLRELDIGRWAGLTRAQIEGADSALLERFESGDPDVPAGGGETRRQLRSRVAAVVRQLGREHSGRRVALVAHLGVIAALRPGLAFANAQWRTMAGSEISGPVAGAARDARG